MKKIVTNSFLLLTTLSSIAAYSQQREIKDSLIYSDPTVSGSSYIYGGSFEYWYSNKSISQPTYSASGKLTQPGFNLFVGKDNITAAISYKGGGSSDVSITTTETSVLGKGAPTEIEGSLRWLSKDKTIFNSVYPYMTVGYLNGHQTNYNGGVKYTAPTLGVGGIIPFNEKYGLRTEFKVLSITQKPDSNNRYSSESRNTSGNTFTGNIYWNFDQDWNAQFGAKKTYYADGGYLSYGLNNTSIGYFFMIGRSYK